MLKSSRLTRGSSLHHAKGKHVTTPGKRPRYARTINDLPQGRQPAQHILFSTMSAREVITVQCGHYSNFIDTHWWNLQVRPAMSIRAMSNVITPFTAGVWILL